MVHEDNLVRQMLLASEPSGSSIGIMGALLIKGAHKIHELASAQGEWRPIIDLPGSSRDEIIVVLRDGTVRTAARGLGTILLGPYGQSADADNWPILWRALPQYSAENKA